LAHAFTRSRSIAARTPFVLHAKAFDVGLELRAGSQRLLERFQTFLPYLSEIVESPPNDSRAYALTGPEDENIYRIFANGRMIAKGTSLTSILETFRSLAMIHVAEHAAKFVFIHAGVVARKGQALVFPGTSFAGKSTLVASLVKAGAVYYSDEYALLDADGLVHPYARNLQMRKPGAGARQRSVPVEEFQGVAGTEAIPISHIYFSQYQATSTWQPKLMPPGIATLQILRHAIPVRRTPSRVLKVLAGITSKASSWHSLRGDADITAKAILAQL
jgi:hypothetical protein